MQHDIMQCVCLRLMVALYLNRGVARQPTDHPIPSLAFTFLTHAELMNRLECVCMRAGLCAVCVYIKST